MNEQPTNTSNYPSAEQIFSTTAPKIEVLAQTRVYPREGIEEYLRQSRLETIQPNIKDLSKNTQKKFALLRDRIDGGQYVSAEERDSYETSTYRFANGVEPLRKEMNTTTRSELSTENGGRIVTTTLTTPTNVDGVIRTSKVITRIEYNSSNKVVSQNSSVGMPTTQKVGELYQYGAQDRTFRKGGNPSTYNPSSDSIYNPIPNNK